MELSSSILNTLKSIGAGGTNNNKISIDSYNLIVKSLFDSFIFNNDDMNLDIYLNTLKLGNVIDRQTDRQT